MYLLQLGIIVNYFKIFYDLWFFIMVFINYCAYLCTYLLIRYNNVYLKKSKA